MGGQQSKIEIILSAVDRGLTTGFQRGTASVKAFFSTVGSGNNLVSALRNNLLQVAGAVAGLSALADVNRMLEENDKATYGFSASLKAARREFGEQVGGLAGWEGAIGRVSEKLRVYSESDIRSAAARTVDMTKRLGLNSEQMERVIELTGDLSAGRTDLVGGIERVTSALRGEAEASEFLGLTLNENYVKAWHEAHDVNQVAWKDLTDLEKAQVRYNVFLEQAAPLYGRAAESVHTYTGAMQLVKKEVADAVANNPDLVAALKDVAVVLRENAPAIGEFAAKIATGAAKAIEFITKNQELLITIAKYGLIFGIAVKAIGTMATAYNGVKAAAVAAIGVQVVPWLNGIGATALGVIPVIVALGKYLQGLTMQSEMFKQSIDSGDYGQAIGQLAGPEAWNDFMSQTTADSIAARVQYLGQQVAAAQGKIKSIRQSVTDNPDDYDIHWETRIQNLQESIAKYNAELEKLQSTGTKAVKAAAAEQTKVQDGMVAGTANSAVQQAEILKKSWKSYEDNLKSATTQMESATSASEISIAQKALEFEKQGMDKREAEVKLTKEKLSLLDQQIAKYAELKRSIPTGDSEGKSAADASAEMDKKINGLRIERIGLLRQEVEGNRAAAKEAADKNKKELEDLQKLSAEKLRFASQEKILTMELERLEAGKLPTALARAEAEMAIDRRVMAERISLKQQELAALKSAEKVDQNDVITKEAELAELAVEKVKQEYANLAAVARESLAATEQAWRRGTGSVEEYRAAVEAAGKQGVLTADEVSERLILSGDNMGAALSLGFQRAREKMQKDAEMMAYIGENIGETIAGGLVSAWDAFTDRTKTAKEALIDFARSTLSWLSQIILKQLLLNALGSAGSSSSAGSGLIGAIAGAFSSTALAGGGSIPGYSPSPTADNIPFWGTAREFVQPVAAVDYYGEGFMELIRRRLFPRNLAHALAGGTLPRIPSGYRLAQGGQVPGQPPATTVKGGDTRLRVINVLDKNMVGDYLRTSDGETAIINMIRRNGSAIRTILG